MDISPNGDVILVVGPHKERLRVHSICLGSASDVFKAMFTPHWREGQGLSEQSPKEVYLAEDNALAMRTVLSIIHHRNDQVPLALAPWEVLQIAITMDTYDLRVALKYASPQWFQPKDELDKSGMGYLVAAGYLLDDMEAFTKCTLALILNYTGSYWELFDDEDIYQVVPPRVFCEYYHLALYAELQLISLVLLEERRSQLRAEIHELLDKLQTTTCERCEWSAIRRKQYTALAQKYRPLQLLEVPVSRVIRDAEVLTRDGAAHKQHPGPIRSFYLEKLPHEETFAGKVEKLRNRAAICLDCLGSNGFEKCISIQHG